MKPVIPSSQPRPDLRAPALRAPALGKPSRCHDTESCEGISSTDIA